jgi:phage-related tail protein
MAHPRPITGNTAAALSSSIALCEAVDLLMKPVTDLQAQIAAAARALDAQIQAVAITANQPGGAEAVYRVARVTYAVAPVTEACAALIQAEADAQAAGDTDAAEAVAVVRAARRAVAAAVRRLRALPRHGSAAKKQNVVLNRVE